ncbi:MAG TPA: hypothetical protein VIG24_01440 [Acidimicrobiia bacterium]
MAELLEGSPGHRPLSSHELNEWIALEHLRVWEQEQSSKKKGR